MAHDTDTLLARFTVEHHIPNSISLARRHESLTVLTELAEQLDGRTLVELSPSDLMAWQGEQLKRGNRPNTVRKKQAMIRAFVGWAYRAQLMSFELTTQLKSVNGVRGATANTRPKPYKRAEIVEFRERLAEKYPLLPRSGRGSRALRQFMRGRGPFNSYLKRHARRLQFEAKVSLALEEGLRSLEIFSLSIDDMHPDNEAVLVRTVKSKPGQLREREVPYTDHSRMCVQDWLEFRELLVPGLDFPWLALCTRDVTRLEILKHHHHALNVIEGHWNWHRFRHTFATERLRSGMPLEQVQVMMGHHNIQQTLGYAEIVSGDVRAEATRSAAAFARNLGLDP